MNLRKYFPVGNVPMVNKGDGNVTWGWRQFFTQMTAQPGPIASVTVGASPYAYQASESGALLIIGGTVSAVSLKRAAITVVTGQIAGFFPMALGDIITVTYSVLPTIKFIPN